jgi:hypothetical protein
MTTAQDEARGIKVGPYEFDHPQMIKARRLWAEAIDRGGVLIEADQELVKFLQVEPIRDRLMADIVNPYAWDADEYGLVFRGAHRPDADMVDRMKAATMICRDLSAMSPVEDHPPMLMISCMCQWLVGNSDLAAAGAAICLSIAPLYDLARLMKTMTDRHIPPLWQVELG